MATKAELVKYLENSMTDLDDVVSDIKQLIYGDSGVGKTVLAMQILQGFVPADKTIVFVDSARGWISLLNHPELRRRTKRIPYEGLTQLDMLVSLIKAGTPPFNNIGGILLDEVSSMSVLDLDSVLKSRSASDGAKDPDLATMPDMGITTERVRRTLIPFLKLDQHVILVSHLREDEVKIGTHATGKMTIRPGMMPKLSNTIRGLVHEVTLMSADITDNGYVRKLQVLPTRKAVAKTRVGGLPSVVSPDKYVAALGEWLEGDKVESPAVLSKLPVESDSAAIVLEDD